MCCLLTSFQNDKNGINKILPLSCNFKDLSLIQALRLSTWMKCNCNVSGGTFYWRLVKWISDGIWSLCYWQTSKSGQEMHLICDNCNTKALSSLIISYLLTSLPRGTNSHKIYCMQNKRKSLNQEIYRQSTSVRQDSKKHIITSNLFYFPENSTSWKYFE